MNIVFIDGLWYAPAKQAYARIKELENAVLEAHSHLREPSSVCSFAGSCKKCGIEYEGTDVYCRNCVADYLYSVLRAKSKQHAEVPA